MPGYKKRNILFFSKKIDNFRVLEYFIKVFLNLKECILILTPANTTNIEIRAQTEAEKYFLREKLKKGLLLNKK
jgi:hypothetical protein